MEDDRRSTRREALVRFVSMVQAIMGKLSVAVTRLELAFRAHLVLIAVHAALLAFGFFTLQNLWNLSDQLSFIIQNMRCR